MGSAYQNVSVTMMYCFIQGEDVEVQFIQILHILREKNTWDDILSKLASTMASKVNHSFIQEILRSISIEASRVMMMALGSTTRSSWIFPIPIYIYYRRLPTDPTEPTLAKRGSILHSMIKVSYTMAKVYEGIVWQHLGVQALAKKVLIVGYYQMIMVQDAKEYMKKCD